MSVLFGSSTPNTFKLGGTQVTALYYNNTQVWPLVSTGVPAGSFQIAGVDWSGPINEWTFKSKAFDETITSSTYDSLLGITTIKSSTSYSLSNFGSVATTAVSASICYELSTSTFNGNTTVTNLYFPDVTVLGATAFKGCTALTACRLDNYTGEEAWTTGNATQAF